MNFSYQDDPMRVQARAAAEAGLTGAKARALEAKRKAVLAFGDPELARRVLGADDPTVAAISGDPNQSASVIGRLRKGYNDQVAQTEEDLNANNLFFGGHRGKLLTDLATQHQQQQVDAQRGLEGQLSGISEGLSGAEGAYRDAVMSGEQGAYQRAQDRALQYGIGPQAPDAPPGPPGTPPPAPAPHPPPPGHQPPLDQFLQRHARQQVVQQARRLVRPRRPALPGGRPAP